MADFNWRKIINFMAYVALMFVAVSLILGKFIPALAVLEEIASIIAYAITAVYAFYYARSKRNPWPMILYVVAVILVILFLVLKVA